MSMMSGRGSEKAAAGMGGSMMGRASSTNLGFAGVAGGITSNLKTLNHLKVNSKFVLLNKFSEIRQQKNEKRL
jgi:hypothetical protein